jgi:nucleotide-binding universal stress UspA family protein
MMRGILLGLDGSAYGEAAVELGVRWAKRFNALLVGLAVVDEPTIRRPEPVPLGAGAFKQHRDETLMADARRRVRELLGRFSVRCAQESVSAKVLEDTGVPHEQILLEAQRYDAILLGKQTYFHFQTQTGPCETLTKVLRSAPRPVVTVPEQPGEGKSIVVAYDGSLQAARALQAFEASGLHALGEVHVAAVDPVRVEAAVRADRARDFLERHGVRVRPLAIESSASPGEVLLEQVRKLDAGLLVMGAYGRAKIVEFFLGSVTRTILKEASVPVFLYH